MMRLTVLVVSVFISTLVHADYPDIILSGGNVERVYDGDTITVNLPGQIDLFGKSLSIRLNGIDTPEMISRCSTAGARALEKTKAIEARDRLWSLMENAKVVTLVAPDRDKYFRVVATVIVDGVPVGKTLIDEGLAYPYDGGTKRGWCGF